jgi:hypothetical protein
MGNGARVNSPKKAADQVLGMIPVEEAKNFLMECLNLPDPINYPDHRPHFERWLRRWQRLFTFQSEDERGNWQTQLIPKGAALLRR